MHWLTFTFKDFFSVLVKNHDIFLLRKRFCRSTNCVDWRLTLWFHRSPKKRGEKAKSKKFCSSWLVVLLVKKMSYFCLQEMHGLRLGLSNFFAAIISSQQCWKKCMRQKKLKTLQRAVLLNMLASNPNGHSIFRSSYRHDSYGKRRKHSKSKVSKKHVSNRICHFLFTYIFHKIWDKPQCLKIILKMWHFL